MAITQEIFYLRRHQQQTTELAIMDTDLKPVLEDLNKVLGRLEKALKSQDVQMMKDAEINIEDNAGSRVEPQTLDILLQQWLEDHKPDDASLIKLRKGLIHRLTHDYAYLNIHALSDEDTIYFKCDTFGNLELYCSLYSFNTGDERTPIRDMSRTDFTENFIIWEVERCWPTSVRTANSQQYKVVSTRSPMISWRAMRN